MTDKELYIIRSRNTDTQVGKGFSNKMEAKAARNALILEYETSESKASKDPITFPWRNDTNAPKPYYISSGKDHPKN